MIKFLIPCYLKLEFSEKEFTYIQLKKRFKTTLHMYSLSTTLKINLLDPTISLLTVTDSTKAT